MGSNVVAAGGSGVGGDGGRLSVTTGSNGATSTGSGGGGAGGTGSGSTTTTSGSGANGVVIICYPGAARPVSFTGTMTTTTAGGVTKHVLTTSGTFTA
jgi:hypothetical protein